MKRARGPVRPGRHQADIDGDFVVFIIGARPDKLHPIRTMRDLGGMRGMGYMLKYLTEHPEKGLLGYETVGMTTFVQYWRSFDQLEAFARGKDDPHLGTWKNYWRRLGTQPRTGIWHETFCVRAGEYEAIYGNMPPYGLGKASRTTPMSEASTARLRLRKTAAHPSSAGLP